MTQAIAELDSDTLNEVVDGYLECAAFADAPEGSCARFTKKAKKQATEECRRFIEACGPLFFQAIDTMGYSPVQFGRDFWFSRKGHGVGFWDRKELEVDVEVEGLTALDRHGVEFRLTGKELGQALHEVAYGNPRVISQFAYKPDVQELYGWLNFI